MLAEDLLPGHWSKTGGSTGEPTLVYHDYEQQRWDKQSVAFARGWWGLRMGQRCFYVWGHSASLASGWAGYKDRLLRPMKDLLRNRMRVNAYRMDRDSLHNHLVRLLRYQPEMIIGYTSSVYLLAQQYLDEGYSKQHLRNIRGIIVTADPCYPFEQEVIQSAFGVPVAIEYGSVEVGEIAYGHPDGTFRILEDRLIVETLSVENDLYQIIVTDLGGRSQPLIRFNMADYCRMPVAVPPNGNGYRTIGMVEGRVLDSIVGDGGRCLHGVALSHIVNVTYPNALRYRFIQGSDKHLRIELQLKPTTSVNPDAENQLLSYLTGELGQGIPIELVYVQEFEPTRSGKFRWVKSDASDSKIKMQQIGD